MKKFYLIHKYKLYNLVHSKSYNKLQEIINNITINQRFNNQNLNLINLSDNGDERNLDDKIRVSFLGNITVGKSTILNCIIGEKIIPTKQSTFRGVVIRHKNIEKFKLYRAKLIKKGNWNNEYYFKNETQPYCEGIENINSYLKNKNKDKNISYEDSYIIIEGKLKIFNEIKLNEKLINSIEFIDFPGMDNNNFNSNNIYMEEFNKFTDCFVYVTDPKNFDDNNNIFSQYENDKNKKNFPLKENFYKICLFLINKSDSLSKEEKIQITNGFYNKILKIESKVPKRKINFSFFSALSFSEYLKLYNQYIESFEKDPLKTLECLYIEWSKSFELKDFKSYIFKTVIEKIEEKFELDVNKKIKVPVQFNNKLKQAFSEILKNKGKIISPKDEDEFIEKLYLLIFQIKEKNFENSKYSKLFFFSLMNVIIYSQCLKINNTNNLFP